MKRHRECDPHFYEMMILCWRSDPSDRPTFAQIAEYVDVRYAVAMADEDAFRDVVERGLDELATELLNVSENGTMWRNEMKK